MGKIENRIIIYFHLEKSKDRFIPGDRYLIPLLRNLIKKKKTSGIEKVFKNLCKSFDKLNIKYEINIPFERLTTKDQIIVLGGPKVLEHYHQSNKIVAGIALMTHPAEWPDLFEQYPVATYLQHSPWTVSLYNRWYGTGKCKTWPSGIDTAFWKPSSGAAKRMLIYVKFLWNKAENEETLLKPILNQLDQKGIDYHLIRYGYYDIKTYQKQLSNSYGMIFLCEHESQGIAYQEAMAMNVPILAWDQGFWLDPHRLAWGETEAVPASSVPYFCEDCGEKFKDFNEFKEKLPLFMKGVSNDKYAPRNYILKHLSLERSAERILEILNEVYS